MSKTAWINTPYPFEQTAGDKWKTILSVSLFLCLFLILVQPFGFSPLERLKLLVGYSVIGSLTLIINYFGIPRLFPTYFDDDDWSVLKAFLFFGYTFLIIGLWNHIYLTLVIRHDLRLLVSGVEIANTLSKMLLIGFIASGFLILFRYNILARKHLEHSQDLNDDLQKRLQTQTPSTNKETILLPLNEKTKSVSRQDLMLISSEGNYLGIYLKSKTDRPPVLYRGRIREAEESTNHYPEFFRCHRSYIVNLRYVKSAHGNTQGLFITLENGDHKIPVARPKIKEFKTRMTDLQLHSINS